MNISITFDVEIWCGGWDDLDARFPAAFERYVYGADKNGYALPKTLEILNRNGLKGVFFVEPLFSYRFGRQYLQEIVDLIRNAGHEVQLHLHPEWADETTPPLLDNIPHKRPYLHQYSYEDQQRLIARGIEALQACGVPRPTSFRAGSYACNRDTLRALAANGIYIDSSVNAAYPGSAVDLDEHERGNQPQVIERVLEYPVTVFSDGFGKPRHWQVGAVGHGESVQLVEKAHAAGFRHLVLVSHNFEMLIPGKSQVDTVVARRFERFCRWLASKADRFPTCGLPSNLPDRARMKWDTDLNVSLVNTSVRFVEQIARRAVEISTR